MQLKRKTSVQAGSMSSLLQLIYGYWSSRQQILCFHKFGATLEI